MRGMQVLRVDGRGLERVVTGRPLRERAERMEWRRAGDSMAGIIWPENNSWVLCSRVTGEWRMRVSEGQPEEREEVFDSVMVCLVVDTDAGTGVDSVGEGQVEGDLWKLEDAAEGKFEENV